MSGTEPQGRVGAIGATLTAVGFVVGASIFFLPGELYRTAGSGVIYAFAVAAVPALLSCIVAAGVARRHAGEGPNYAVVRMGLGPAAAAATMFAIIASSIAAVALLALGMSDFVAALAGLGSESRISLACFSILGFMGINLLGARSSVLLQSVMTLALIAALALLPIFGFSAIEVANYRPPDRDFVGPTLLAIIPASFSYLGFALVVGIVSEMRRPERDFPIAMIASFLIVLLLYLGVVLTTVGVLDPQTLLTADTPVVAAAQVVMPTEIANFVAFSAILAAATSINGLLLVIGHDVAALARNHDLPAILGPLKGGTPVAALIFMSGIAVLVTLAATTLQAYAMATVLAFLFAQALISAAVLKLRAATQPQGEWRARCEGFACWALILTAALVITATAWTNVTALSIVAAVVGAGLVARALVPRWQRDG